MRQSRKMCVPAALLLSPVDVHHLNPCTPGQHFEQGHTGKELNLSHVVLPNLCSLQHEWRPSSAQLLQEVCNERGVCLSGRTCALLLQLCAAPVCLCAGSKSLRVHLAWFVPACGSALRQVQCFPWPSQSGLATAVCPCLAAEGSAAAAANAYPTAC